MTIYYQQLIPLTGYLSLKLQAPYSIEKNKNLLALPGFIGTFATYLQNTTKDIIIFNE